MTPDDAPDPALAKAINSLSAVSFASALAQSVDCVKLVSLDGKIQYMNHNGRCALEIDDTYTVEGSSWADMWPGAARQTVIDACADAATGKTVLFRAFSPTMKGASRWWDVLVSPVADTQGHIAGCLAISRDVTLNEHTREALKIAAAEMKHRLGNTYQMIISLIMMSARGNDDHTQFAAQMADRLGALGRAQALFTDDNAPCVLDALIPALVSPLGSEAGRVTIDALPAITIGQSQADAIALVMGELAVNSTKHGAFGKGGDVHVSANLEADLLTITWQEHCEAPVRHRSRDGGQGLSLMGQIMRVRGGSMVIEWQSHGLTATITLQLE